MNVIFKAIHADDQFLLLRTKHELVSVQEPENKESVYHTGDP
jgi:hypothetical protein